MPDSHTEAAFSRICSIAWPRSSMLSLESEALLMAECIRRLAIWGSILNIKRIISIPFDVAEYKEPTIRANPEILNKLRHHLTSLRANSVPINHYAQDICEWALHWAALRDKDIPDMTEHRDPYEPLLYMFDKGGSFYINQGINVGGGTISRGNWLSYADKPPLWLEEEGFTTSLRPDEGG